MSCVVIMNEKKCTCGGTIKSDECIIDEFIVHCMKCDKCGEILFTPEQTKELIRLRDANQKIQAQRKIIKVGSSIAALLPKKVEDFGIHEGNVNVRVLSTNALMLKFSKNII